jgi:tol-pal system protein YbgF
MRPLPRIVVATFRIVRNKTMSQARPLAWLVAVAALTAALPAHSQLFKDEELHNRVRALESQRPNDVRRVDGLESRVESRAEVQARQIIDLNSQLDAQKQEIARLRGQLEVLTNEIENTAKRQKDFYVDLDGRVRKLETPPPAPEKPKGPSADEQKTYENCLNLVKAANYKGAVEAFTVVLKTYPQSTLAPSAQYWVGNSLFALRDYKGAIAAQQHVVDTWPDDPKAPDAMLNIASAQIDMKEARGARATLDALIRKYPQSDAAATAKQRLSKLR